MRVFAWANCTPLGVASFTANVGTPVEIPAGSTKTEAALRVETAVRGEVARRGFPLELMGPVMSRPILEETTRAEYEAVFGEVPRGIKFADERE